LRLVDLDRRRVAAKPAELDREPAWRLDILVQVPVDGAIEERRWTFWVDLDEGSASAVLRGEEAPPATESGQC
jgi:hypothetical protein